MHVKCKEEKIRSDRVGSNATKFSSNSGMAQQLVGIRDAKGCRLISAPLVLIQSNQTSEVFLRYRGAGLSQKKMRGLEDEFV